MASVGMKNYGHGFVAVTAPLSRPIMASNATYTQSVSLKFFGTVVAVDIATDNWTLTADRLFRQAN